MNNRVPKIFAGLLGSLILVVSLSFFLISLVSDRFIDNVDMFDDTIQSVSSTFIEENRPELRGIIEEKLRGQELPPKDELLFACDHLDLVQGDMVDFLTPQYCAGLPPMSQEQIDVDLHDFLIDVNIQKLIDAASSGQGAQDVMTQINQIKNPVPSYVVFILFVLFYLIGACLLLASSGFNLILGFYKVVLKTVLVLLTFTLFLFLISIVPLDTFVNFLQFIISGLNIDIPALPGVMLNFVLAIILEWIRITTNAVLPWVAVCTVPFVLLTIYLGRKRNQVTAATSQALKEKNVENQIKV